MARKITEVQGNRLRVALHNKLIHQNEVARYLGISRQAFEHRLNGRTAFTDKQFEDTCDYAGKTTRQILEGDISYEA